MDYFKPRCGCTGIGSVPHKTYKKVLDHVIEEFDFPYWPQFINKGFRESMYAQFSEGLPSLNVDFESETLFFDTDNFSELEQFYENVEEQNFDYFKISRNYAVGLHEFLKKANNLDTVKGQITGPVSFGLSVLDQDKRPILYDTDFFDVVVECLAMKTRWQVRKLKEVSDKVIIFFDEPYMSSYGSSYINLNEETVIDSLNTILDAAKEEGAITGVHCCGNTDWGLIMNTNTDILSFDAYNFSDKLLLYSKSVASFLEKGSIAWGIVPTSNDILNESCESLVFKLEHKMEELIKRGVDPNLIFERAIITPSCGAGSLSNKATDKVLNLTWNVSSIMSQKYF